MRIARRQGFTLMELVVAIVLVAIIAGLILPRLLSTGEREARAEAEAVAQLFGAAARRGAMTTQRVAIDCSEGSFALLTLRTADPERFDSGDMRWATDPLAPAVPLVHLRVLSAFRDGASLDGRGWRVEVGSDARAELSVDLESGSGRRWTVLLPAEGTGALLLSDGDEGGAPARSVDLDRTGRGMSAW